MKNDIIYTEEQRMSRPLLWFLFAISNLSLIGYLVAGYYYRWEPALTAGLSSLLIVAGISLLLTLFTLWFRLETRITSENISVRLFPLQIKFRVFHWRDIREASVRTYNPLLEYGGWGIRGWGKNKALNVRGNKGLQLVLMNGNRLLIGTGNAEKLESALDKVRGEAV